MNATAAYKPRSGFSLLELLAVVSIVGIIAALVVPRVATSTASSRDRVRESHLSQLNRLVETYRIEQDAFPGDLSDLATDGYLPDGMPVDPDGGSYSLNPTTHRVDYTAP